jgi:hypothetical protein
MRVFTCLRNSITFEIEFQRILKRAPAAAATVELTRLPVVNVEAKLHELTSPGFPDNECGESSLRSGATETTSILRAKTTGSSHDLREYR